MQRKLISLIVLILILGFVFSLSVPFVKYSSDSVDSHACLPTDSTCLYREVVSVDDSNIISCSSPSAVKVIGLSEVTNAHAEIKSFSDYYSKNICLKKSLLDDGSYYFTTTNSDCDSGYTCLFGLSGANNAHLSTCDVFGSSEIKFCVRNNVSVPQTINGICFSHGVYQTGTTIVPINERCLVGTDANYSDFNSDYIASWSCLGSGVGAVSANCYAFTTDCTNPMCTISQNACSIASFEVISSSITNKTKISYSCYNDGRDVNLAIFDLEGNQLFPFSGGQYSLKDANSCGTIEKTITIDDWPLSETKKANYLAQLSIGNNCVKQAFFTVVNDSNNNSSFIPDSNPLIALVICLSLMLFFVRKEGFK